MQKHYRNKKNGEVKMLSPQIIKASGDEEFWEELTAEEIALLEGKVTDEQEQTEAVNTQVTATPVVSKVVGGGSKKPSEPKKDEPSDDKPNDNGVNPKSDGKDGENSDEIIAVTANELKEQ
jgi:hypothetical protein